MISRRRVLLGLGLGAPLVALTAACSSSAAAVAPAADVRWHTDWTARPAGAVPVVGDDGVPFRLLQEGFARPPRVVGGALEAGLPDTTSMSSVAQEARERIRRIGATFAFGRGSDQGALVLATWTGVPFVHTPCQLVITPGQWQYSVSEDRGTLRTVGQGALTAPLPQDGTTPVTVDVTVAGDSATLHLPDGGTATVQDPRIATTLATVPSWAFYRNAAGGADVRLLRSWAG